MQVHAPIECWVPLPRYSCFSLVSCSPWASRLSIMASPSWALFQVLGAGEKRENTWMRRGLQGYKPALTQDSSTVKHHLLTREVQIQYIGIELTLEAAVLFCISFESMKPCAHANASVVIHLGLSISPSFSWLEIIQIERGLWIAHSQRHTTDPTQLCWEKGFYED